MSPPRWSNENPGLLEIYGFGLVLVTPARNDSALQLAGSSRTLHKPNGTYTLLADGDSMRAWAKFAAIGVMTALSCSICHAATVTRTLTDPDGIPFKGAFVQVQNGKTHMTIMALSYDQGRYRVENMRTER